MITILVVVGCSPPPHIRCLSVVTSGLHGVLGLRVAEIDGSVCLVFQGFRVKGLGFRGLAV